MKKIIPFIAAWSFAIGAASECANFAGHWGEMECEEFGNFTSSDYNYPSLSIKQNGCAEFDFGGGEAVSEIGKILAIKDAPSDIRTEATIEGKWIDDSQQTLEMKLEMVRYKSTREEELSSRIATYKIENGKLIVDIKRKDGGYRWKNLSGARCTYSHRG